MRKRRLTKAELFFMRPANIDRNITRIREEIKRLDYVMLPGSNFSQTKVKTVPEDLIAKYVTEKIELEDRLVMLQEGYLVALASVQDVLNTLAEKDSRAALILSDLYICQKSMTKIADEYSYNRQHLYKIRDAALKRAWTIKKGMEKAPPGQ